MRELITTWLELLGLLLLVSAVVVLVWPFTVSGALAVAGLGVLGTSYAIIAAGPKPPKPRGDEL